MSTDGLHIIAEHDSADNSNVSKTIVKYKKSSCHFCNEWFDSQTFTSYEVAKTCRVKKRKMSKAKKEKVIEKEKYRKGESGRIMKNDLQTNAEHDSADNSNVSKAIVEYKKSSCQFCNEWISSQIFTEHLIHCGQVLEQCPNTCNAFLPRIRMRHHLKECPRGLHRNSNNNYEQQSLETQRLLLLEQDINALRSVLNEEIRQRLHLITDVGSLRNQNQEAQEEMQKMQDAIQSLKRRFDEEHNERNYEVEQCQNDFRYCYDQCQSIKSESRNEVVELEKHINELSLKLTKHQNHLNDNIMALEEMMSQHEQLNNNKFIQTEDFMNGVSNDLKTKFMANNELVNKLMTLDVEVKSMKSIVCETEERCEKLEKTISGMDRNVHHTMQAITDIEQHLAAQQRANSLLNTRGHLIWRIKDYTKKFEEAKQYDAVLHSSMFSNRAFGYALRMDIYLNGKGTWKGRNMIVCLNVIAGEYDALLAWPCRLQADIVLRDQTFGTSNAPQDHVKTINVRKKSDAVLENNQYFHIPHKIINSRNYIRNDCIFIEVRVLKS